MDVTFDTLKFPNLMEANAEQPLNIYDIRVTLEVASPDKSIDFNDVQSLNNDFIEVTLETSSPVKSTEERFVIP